MTVSKGISLERLIRSVLYLVFGSGCVGLVFSGKITAYLHPRMSVWILLAGIIFLALSAMEIARRRQPLAPSLPILGYYALLVVVVLVSQFPLIGPVAMSRLELPIHISHAVKPPELDAIRPGDDEFWQVYNLLYDTPGYYAGREIILSGFICRELHFPNHVALVGRNLMWCCSADMGLIGFLARGVELDSLASGEWVEVAGKLAVISYDVAKNGTSRPVPIIEISRFKILRNHPSQNIFPR